MGDIVFRRINGRIIPIKSKDGSGKVKRAPAAPSGLSTGGKVALALSAGAATAGAALLARRFGIRPNLKALAYHGAEVTGLGILAIPSIQHYRGKKIKKNTYHATEVGGLGLLAVPSALAIGKMFVKRG